MKKYLLFIAFGAMMASCSVQRTTTSKSVDVFSNLSSYTLADLDIAQTKVSAEITRKKELKKLPLNILKEKVVAKALASINGDIMVEPRFEITMRKGKVRFISVTGYPATFKNFRKGEIKTNDCYHFQTNK